jgi:hypothetical protein
MDTGIIESFPKDSLLIIVSIIANYVVKALKKDYKDLKTMERLWRDHFPQLIEDETQNVVGTRKKRTLPDFTILAAKRTILPTRKEVLKYYLKKDFGEKIVSDIKIKGDVNHIIHGSPVVSELSQSAIFKYEHAIDFGYKTDTGVIYEVNAGDYEEASKIEITSKEWLIIDKDSKEVLVEPRRKSDKTYYVDGAIVMRCEDPYCKASSEGKGRSFLGFLGTHAPGSYAAEAIFRVPQLIEKFDKKLHENDIHDDPFVAAVEIRFEKYPFETPPEDNRIAALEIKRIEKLTKIKNRIGLVKPNSCC